MAYDEELVERLRELLAADPDVTERRMFGGLAFLVNGNMSVTASRDGGLLLRGHPDAGAELLARPHTAPFVSRGRELRGWVRVAPAGVESDVDLARWTELAVGHARTLPPKGGRA